jgi:glycosyltransferase involved in cell wall biosynthesis
MSSPVIPIPRVTVVTPVYNGAVFLREAIDSILRQTFTDFEYLIIDDGSTDATPAFLHEAARADTRIRVVTQAHAGIAVARNTGITLARADLLAHQDADDLSLPDRLARQVAFLDAHPGVVMVGTFGRVIEGGITLFRELRNPTDSATLRKGMLRNAGFLNGSLMMRRWAVQEVGGYDPSFAVLSDYDLWLRLAERFELANIPEALYVLRRHEASTTAGADMSRYMSKAVAAARARGVLDARDPGHHPSY